MGAEATERADRGGVVPAITHSFLLVIAAFAVGWVLAVAGAAAFVTAGVRVTPALPPGVTAATTALQFVGFLVVGYWYVDRVVEPDLVHLRRPVLRDLGWIVVGLGALYMATLGLDALLSALDVEVASHVAIEAGREQPVLFLYLAAVSVLFVAPGEELIFRGLVQGLFRRAVGIVPAITVAASVFGLVHYLSLTAGAGGQLTLASIAAYVALAAVLGVVLGALYERTETLLVPIAVHGLWNAYQFLLVYAVEMGYVDVPV